MRGLLAAALVGAGWLLGAQVPRPSPEFTVLTPGGGKLLLSQFRGKVVAVEFLYTTCPHCQHASALMNKLYAEYGPKGFQPLGVAFNPMSNMLVGDFVRGLGLKYPVGFSSRDAVVHYLQHDPNYMLHVPQMVFIDKKGTIRHQSLPMNDSQAHSESYMRSMIEKLLKENAPPPAHRRAAKKAS